MRSYLFFTDNTIRFIQSIRFSLSRDLGVVFKQLYKLIKRIYNIKIRSYRFDNEINKLSITNQLILKGIAYEPTKTYVYYQNSIAKRYNRNIRERALIIIQERIIISKYKSIIANKIEELLREQKSIIPENLQLEAIDYTIQLKNRYLVRVLRKRPKKTLQYILYNIKSNFEREKIQRSRA